MKIDSIYDKLASTYNQEHSAQILQMANQVAFHAIEDTTDSVQTILALGVGDGVYLKPYQNRFAKAHIHGLDISAKMLERAHSYIDLTTYQGDIAHASDIITSREFDILMAHFVLAYVPIEQVLSQSHQLLAKGGRLSIVSNTQASFPTMRGIYDRLKQSSSMWHRYIANYIDKTLNSVHVPQSMDDLVSQIKAYGFTIEQANVKQYPVTLTDEANVYQFFIEGSWFASALNHRYIPATMLTRIIKQLIHKHVDVPLNEEANIAVVIARKL